jgi:hypothetical protein
LLCHIGYIDNEGIKNKLKREMRQMAFVNMLKDTALAAFAWYVAVNAKHQRLNTDE